MDSGFPELTDSFLFGQDIFYTQFNEIEFYVEDIDQENFYYNVLNKLFPDIKFEKIFPLNGKTNVIESAKSNIGHNKKVFIVDLDFDNILEKKLRIENLFYLHKYSIENYLISKNSIFEIIKNKNPKLKTKQIEEQLDFNNLLESAAHCLKELALTFVVIQKHDLGIKYYGINCSRDFDFTKHPAEYRDIYIRNYLDNVETQLKQRDGRFTLKGQQEKFNNYFKDLTLSMTNIPGKHILKFLKERLHSLGCISNMSTETFIYTLSRDYNENELDYLKNDIFHFINN